MSWFVGGFTPGLAPNIPLAAQIPQPGFQDHPESWYKQPGTLPSEEQKQLLAYLNQLVADLDSDDAGRWEEWGIVPDYWPGDLGKDQDRKRTRNVARWRICLELRWSDPIRLSEGLNHIKWLVDHFESYGNRSVTQDPALCIYLAAALEMGGLDDSKALELLSTPGLLIASTVSNRNQLLARACLSRLLRRAGRVEDAVEQEEEICAWIRGHQQLTMSPSQVLCQLRVGNESSNPIIDRLGHDHFNDYVELPRTEMLGPGGIPSQLTSSGNQNNTNDIFSFRPLEANKRGKHECWVSGCRSTAGLSRCSKCKVGLYCSTKHQKEAWPRHKRLCDGYLAKHRAQTQTSSV